MKPTDEYRRNSIVNFDGFIDDYTMFEQTVIDKEGLVIEEIKHKI